MNEMIPDPNMLFRYFRCETTERENAGIEAWASETPENEKVFSDIAKIYYAERSRKGAGRWDSASAYRKVNRRIHKGTVRLRYSVIAAAALLLVVLNTVFWISNPADKDKYITLSSNREKVVEYTLPDGSRVFLNKNSSLTFPVQYGGRERNVTLNGEAFFDVAKDERKPFIVSSSDIRVKVHGTQFKVKSFEDNPNVDINLISGSITFETTDENRFSYTMKPGEMIKYDRNTHSIKEYTMNNMKSSSSVRKIRFMDQKLEDIAFDMECIFGKKIIIDGEELAQTRYYASFINDENVYQILNALNSNKVMNIQEVEDVILISPEKH